eukprot:5918901-Amphidinium_carterae.1
MPPLSVNSSHGCPLQHEQLEGSYVTSKGRLTGRSPSVCVCKNASGMHTHMKERHGNEQRHLTARLAATMLKCVQTCTLF